jgi:hypothetical protein
VSKFGDSTVVDRGLASSITIEPLTKALPVTVTLVPWSPTFAELGLIDKSSGTRLVNANADGLFARPPPGDGLFTAKPYVPATAPLAAGIVAVI